MVLWINQSFMLIYASMQSKSAYLCQASIMASTLFGSVGGCCGEHLLEDNVGSAKFAGLIFVHSKVEVAWHTDPQCSNIQLLAPMA